MSREFEECKKLGKIYEQAVMWQLIVNQLALSRRRQNYSVDIIGDKDENPDRWKEGIDVLECWHEDGVEHPRGHEVKAEVRYTMNAYGNRMAKEHQIELQPFTKCTGEELAKGTGLLFIETERKGKPGWYPKLKEALSDGIERYIWFVLVKDCIPLSECKRGDIEFPDACLMPEWRNNVMLKVYVPKFIEVFEKNESKYIEKDNHEDKARGKLMPVCELWKQPEKLNFEWIDAGGNQITSFFEGLESHPCTGSGAVLYCDSSRTTEIFEKQ